MAKKLPVRIVYKDRILSLDVSLSSANYLCDVCCFSTKNYDCLVLYELCRDSVTGYLRQYLFIIIDKKTKEIKQVKYSNTGRFVTSYIVKNHNSDTLIIFSNESHSIKKFSTSIGYYFLSTLDLNTTQIVETTLYIDASHVNDEECLILEERPYEHCIRNKSYDCDEIIDNVVLLPILLDFYGHPSHIMWEAREFFLSDPIICSIFGNSKTAKKNNVSIGGFSFHLESKFDKKFLIRNLRDRFYSLRTRAGYSSYYRIFCSLNGDVYFYIPYGEKIILSGITYNELLLAPFAASCKTGSSFYRIVPTLSGTITVFHPALFSYLFYDGFWFFHSEDGDKVWPLCIFSEEMFSDFLSSFVLLLSRVGDQPTIICRIEETKDESFC